MQKENRMLLYKIKDEHGKIIAAFATEADRDVCLDALSDYWGTNFEAVDTE